MIIKLLNSYKKWLQKPSKYYYIQHLIYPFAMDEFLEAIISSLTR